MTEWEDLTPGAFRDKLPHVAIAAGDPTDLTPWIKNIVWDRAVDDDLAPGTFIPGLTTGATLTFSGVWDAWHGPPEADPLDEALAAAGITDPKPAHWLRIERIKDFDAEQQATRARLAREWEPGDSESEYT